MEFSSNLKSFGQTSSFFNLERLVSLKITARDIFDKTLNLHDIWCLTASSSSSKYFMLFDFLCFFECHICARAVYTIESTWRHVLSKSGHVTILKRWFWNSFYYSNYGSFSKNRNMERLRKFCRFQKTKNLDTLSDLKQLNWRTFPLPDRQNSAWSNYAKASPIKQQFPSFALLFTQ